jgi:DNA mismatch repair protein MutS2
MMNPKTLKKLEWQSVVDLLAQFCQTQEGQARSFTLRPTLTRGEILAHWQQVEPMCLLAGEKKQPPIGDLTPVAPILHAAGIGQVLEGTQIAAIGTLLSATQQVQDYLTTHAPRCAPFATLRNELQALPPLARKIKKTVDPEGILLDEASAELSKIRRQKHNLRNRVEQKLKTLLSDGELEKYLQDDFFTVRSERYVLPIRIDGRGRVPGSILDTSVSGQTLFIEPTAIRELNEQLQELDLAEKIEILRIFRELTAEIATHTSLLADNYRRLIDLDVAFSQAAFAHSFDATSIELPTVPTIDLRQARHPLVNPPQGGKVVANDIQFEDTTCILLISGPNAGGKTVVLKTLGLCLLFAKAGT